jgi:hypothetical protein
MENLFIAFIEFIFFKSDLTEVRKLEKMLEYSRFDSIDISNIKKSFEIEKEFNPPYLFWMIQRIE